MHFADFSVDKFLAGIQVPWSLQCLPVEDDRDRESLRQLGQARGDLAGIGFEAAQPDRLCPAPAAIANGFGGEEDPTVQTVKVALGIRPLHIGRTVPADLPLEAEPSGQHAQGVTLTGLNDKISAVGMATRQPLLPNPKC